MAEARVLAVIPARYGSTRFPGKALAVLAGKPMIQWVYEQVKQASLIDEIVVATDDQRIMDACSSFGAEAVMTRVDHQTGTDRIAEAIEGKSADLVVNIQGDEPLISPQVLDQLVEEMLARPDADMGTAAVPLDLDSEATTNPNVVKAIVAQNGLALYFTRSTAPFARDERPQDAPILQHWGLYAYRPSFLHAFVEWDQSPLERCESLEQLRALENGAKIYVLITNESAVGVDTPEDAKEVEQLLLAREQQA